MGRKKGKSSPLTPLSSRIWLHFLHLCDPLYMFLSYTVLREVSLYLSPLPLLVSLSNAHLFIFNFRTQIKSKEKLNFHFRSGSIVCLSDLDSVICIAGNDWERRCFEVDLQDYGMERREDMRIMRAWPGAALYKGLIYVFGGVGYNLSSEHFHCLRNQWTLLPNMHTAKHSFTPTIYGRCIYLCSPQAGTNIEVFSPHVPSYDLLPVLYPTHSSASVSLLMRDLVVILTSEGERVRWNVGEREMKTGELRCERLEWMLCWGNVIKSQTYAYWMVNNGTIVKYAMGENTVSLYL